MHARCTSRAQLLLYADLPPSRAPTRPRLLGQTYDCNDKEVNGQHDDYSHLDNGQPVASRTSKGGTVTTRAKAECAIEGVLADYRLASDFATTFRFSRFNAVAASVRNVSALKGAVGPAHAFVHPGREAGR